MRILPAVVALAFSCALCVTRLSAQAEAPLAVPAGDVIPDIRVIIDISGSMKQNDPQNLRRSALELLVQLFPEGSKAGVWTFGQWVNMLVPHKLVTPAWRERALSRAQKVNSVALHTNIPEALVRATDDIDHLKPGYKTSLILLTDGMVDVSKSPEENTKARQRIIDEILPRLRDAGMTVHTVALSNNADKELMELLALETNGLAAVAETAEDLTPIFLQAFDATVAAEQVPLEGNSFLVDSSIEEFTALVFRKPGSNKAVLVAPDRKKYDSISKDADVEWLSQKNYDLITVKHPYEGQWLINADLEPNSRVTIVSNLSLHVNGLSKNLFKGGSTRITASLKEDKQTIVNPQLLQLVDMSVDVTKRRNADQQWNISLSERDGVPDDGVFTTDLSMLQDTGLYEIVVTANGKTFQRRYREIVELRNNFLASSISSDDTPPNHEVKLSAVNPAMDLDSLSVTATVIHPNGRREQRTPVASAKRTWVLEVMGESQSGMLTVDFDISGRFRDGLTLNQQVSEHIEHRVIGSPFISQPEPEPVQEKPEPAPEEPKPAPEPEPEPEPLPEAEPTDEQGMDIKTIALYVGIGIGNLLVFVLGYYVYKMVTSKPSSRVLDREDEDEDEDEDEQAQEGDGAEESELPAEPKNESDSVADEIAELDTEILATEAEDEIAEIDLDLEDTELGQTPEETKTEPEDLGDILDLPDDAIDIDPGADDETK